MGCIGTAKKFPFHQYILFKNDLFGYYGIKKPVNISRGLSALTPRFQTQKELEDYLVSQGYKVKILAKYGG